MYPAAATMATNFYPRPPRGGRRLLPEKLEAHGLISIHALREEGDHRHEGFFCLGGYFYPRPPRGGRRFAHLIGSNPLKFLSTPSARRATECKIMDNIKVLFLSTPSARRATAGGCEHLHRQHISIHALREEGDARREPLKGAANISIHALREEGDPLTAENVADVVAFLSTPSARRATCRGKSLRRPCANFYPRPPRGGRPRTRRTRPSPMTFLSTPSARRATACVGVLVRAGEISIHALREEGDALSSAMGTPINEFLSTPSARRATHLGLQQHHDGRHFYPRPPRGGRRRHQRGIQADFGISIHALREEGDARRQLWKMWSKPFLSTPSARRATLSKICFT